METMQGKRRKLEFFHTKGIKKEENKEILKSQRLNILSVPIPRLLPQPFRSPPSFFLCRIFDFVDGESSECSTG